jgi:transcriptional regulator with XRE-family HTH domain
MVDWAMIGARIRQARMRKRPDGRRLTQADLAAALEVTRPHITNVEKGRDKLSLDKLVLVADETNTSLAAADVLKNAAHATLLAAYDAMAEEHRQALLAMATGLARPANVATESRPLSAEKPKKSARVPATEATG